MKARLALVSCALLAGCAVGPDYERPSQAVPAGWRAGAVATTADGEQKALADLAWWTLFGDPVLDRLVAETLANNRDLKIATARIAEAAGVLTSTRAQLFPQLGADAGGVRGRNPTAGYRIAEQYSATFGVSWEIDLFGRIRRASEAAQAQVLASVEARSGVALALAGSMAQSYINLRDLDNELEISRLTLASREEALRIFELRYAAGVISELELAQVRSEVEVARIAIPSLERQITAQENAISVLLGSLPGPVPRGKTLPELAIPLPPPGLPSALIGRRPDIRQAEQNLIALNAQIGVARAAYFPTVSLTGMLGSVSSSYSALFSGPTKVWSYGADLAVPIFTAGAIGGQVAAAEARQIQGLEAYRRTIEEAFREVEDGLSGSLKAREVTDGRLRQVKDLEIYARAARLRYEAGYSAYLEVLDAERSLFQAQINASQARAQSLVAITNLYKALGGGWQVAAQ